MARQRDRKAEYQRRNDRAKTEGWKSYSEKRKALKQRIDKPADFREKQRIRPAAKEVFAAHPDADFSSWDDNPSAWWEEDSDEFTPEELKKLYYHVE